MQHNMQYLMTVLLGAMGFSDPLQGETLLWASIVVDSSRIRENY
jgi:hypothetical protein